MLILLSFLHANVTRNELISLVQPNELFPINAVVIIMIICRCYQINNPSEICSESWEIVRSLVDAKYVYLINIW